MTGFRVQGADTDHVKVVIHKVKLSKEIGERSGKLSTKLEKIGTFT